MHFTTPKRLKPTKKRGLQYLICVRIKDLQSLKVILLGKNPSILLRAQLLEFILLRSLLEMCSSKVIMRAVDFTTPRTLIVGRPGLDEGNHLRKHQKPKMLPHSFYRFFLFTMENMTKDVLQHRASIKI